MARVFEPLNQACLVRSKLFEGSFAFTFIAEKKVRSIYGVRVSVLA